MEQNCHSWRRWAAEPDPSRVLGHIATKARAKIELVATKTFCSRRISDNEFYELISQVVPAPITEGPPPAKRYREAEFEKISKLLDMRGRWNWALRPRTYVVLYAIGLENAMDSFVEDNRSDIFLPYRKGNLPNVLKGTDRERFLEYQGNVLTGKGAALERGGGAHQHFLQGHADSLCFINCGILGRGMAGFQTQVDHVFGKRTLNQFALKKIRRTGFPNDDERSIALFTNELDILKSLRHRHIVQLVGSYTDKDCVGLLMSPVADKNLANFMREALPPQEQQDRKIKIRTFFGCIASAIDYLHNNEKATIRHKDIKPENILVKGDKVYVADFGTSHASTGETSMTEGTQRFWTPKYLAPEALMFRDKPSDVWALGCVYLEMSTILAGWTIEDITRFFAIEGTRKKPYYQNRPAMDKWLGQLGKHFRESDVPQDAWLVDLIDMMCQQEPDARLEAQDIVRRILEFDSATPYHGLCCDKATWGSGLDSITLETNEDTCEELTICEEEEIIQSVDATPSEQSFRSNLYRPPTVEDEEVTLEALPNLPPREPRGIMEEVTAPIIEDATRGIANDVNVDGWTTSHIVGPFERSAPAVSSPKPAEHPDFPSSAHGPNDLSCPWPNCGRSKSTLKAPFQGFAAFRKHLRTEHLVHELGLSRLYEQDDGRITLNPDSGVFVQLKRRSGHARNHSRGRFPELPRERRPQTLDIERNISRPSSSKTEYHINAEPLDASVIAGSGVDQSHDSFGIPRATPAPSYLLASKNRFLRSEVSQRGLTKPLFVYGTLMFPSVLKSRSRWFNNAQGVYSSEQSRRLRTSSYDWNKISDHIQNAAEVMTPALLQGYSRTRRRGTSLAYLSPDGYDPYSTKKSTTTGFLIFGLSPEALASLTHLYEDGGPRHLFEEGPSDTSRWNETQLSLKDVTVSISVTEGTNVDVRAVTFATAASAFVSWRGQAWDVNDFLRSVSFSKMTNRMEAGESIREESEIASALGTNILLLGDRLVAKVIKNSPDELQRLLNHGYDVDAPSGEYGTALQAAASKGNVTLVLMLIDAGADMDAEGGEYGCALIAAVVWKHDVVVKTLLSYGANVFTAGGRYISALYQAVDFGHTEIAHMLLEKGAWMTEDYRELLDLAAERGNRDIRRELELYDVRQMHLLKSPSIGIRETNVEQHKAGTNQVSNVFEDFVVKYELGIHQSTKPRQTSLQKNTKLGVSVLLEMGKLKGQVGKWTGIKGVKLLRVALENGFPERMIKDLRPYMHRWSLIQEFFTNTLKGTLGDAVKPVQHTKLLDVEEEHRDALRRYY